MRFRDLPRVYTRLGGLLAGSFARQLGAHLPWPFATWARGTYELFSPIGHFAPEPLRDGWAVAMQDGGELPPVLMVPGFLGPGILMFPLAVFLRAHGRHVEILRTFPALGGVASTAKRVATAVERLKKSTLCARVDLVAHSMGGLACRYYMDHLMGLPDIRRFVSIATPHLGTRLANVRVTRSARDMQPGNALLTEMAERAPAAGVRCFTIRAGWDQIVVPREHGRWDGHARDHELPWAEHWAVQLDPRTLALVLTLLDEAEPLVTEVDERGVPEAGEPLATEITEPPVTDAPGVTP
jgi:pimeloyl-ACP methyl ester carboxylesterase